MFKKSQLDSFISYVIGVSKYGGKKKTIELKQTGTNLAICLAKKNAFE